MVNIFWFRRDLRLKDNRGLSECLKSDFPTLPIFIFDTNILKKLADKKDARVTFIWQSLLELREELKERGSDLHICYGSPEKVFNKLIADFSIHEVYTNHDYEPSAIDRDQKVEQVLIQNKIKLKTFKDQCYFEKTEILKKDNQPYTMFTSYSKEWLKKLKASKIESFQVQNNFHQFQSDSIKDISEIGFQISSAHFPKKSVSAKIIKSYDKNRNYPYMDGTSLLGLHLRFGTISIRKCVQVASELNLTWLSELIWRDFFMQILWNFPHVVNQSFKDKYDQIEWLNDKKDFQSWCQGKTGYPIVDAGMRQLNQTGYMHNRVRMIVASFLTKHLLIDWRWGEKYFAEKLLDYDLSANNGNWQWAAGTGCDAAPYFRIY